MLGFIEQMINFILALIMIQFASIIMLLFVANFFSSIIIIYICCQVQEPGCFLRSMPEISDREFGHVAWTREEVLSRVGVVIAVGAGVDNSWV